MQYAHDLGIDNFYAFGIRCKILDEEDLPLLYKWRNEEDIRKFMDDGRFVSMQVIKFWYRKIYNKNTVFPYIVYIENMPCAYIEIKNIDYTKSIAELGIYIFGNKYIGKGIAEKTALCWEIFLAKINIKTAFTCIHSNNSRSIAFFEKIGGVRTHSRGNFFIYTHDEEKRRESIIKIAKKYNVEQEFLYLLNSR